MVQPKAKAVHYKTIPAQEVGEEAPCSTISWLIDGPKDGAPVYALRMIEVAAGGHTPDHTHSHEHENFVVEGRGRVRLGDEWHAIEPGYVILVPPGIRHQYQNTGDTTLKFLCGVPVER